MAAAALEQFAVALNKAEKPDLVLYTTPKMAICGWRVEVLLQHLNIPYEVKVVNLMKGEQYGEEFQKLNHRGKVPVLVDNINDVVVCESVAIITYIAHTWGKGQLIPSKSAADFAKYQELVFRYSNCLNPTYFEIATFLFGAPVDQAKAEARFKELQHWDNYLEGKDYFVGELSIVDFILLDQLWAAQIGGLDYEKAGFKNLAAWWKRITAIKAVEETSPVEGHIAFRDSRYPEGIPDLYSQYYPKQE